MTFLGKTSKLLGANVVFQNEDRFIRSRGPQRLGSLCRDDLCGAELRGGGMEMVFENPRIQKDGL